ncbi:hypothetical protein O3M35_002236 [Rhynocoris fuscipes]|uniref:Peptidase S1 domain-containing protein n=1 Tax=Rhynocoris fuscipes TaxID=488301 RepID=A0AAW1CT02_9HEMI
MYYTADCMKKTNAVYGGERETTEIPYLVMIKNDYFHKFTVCGGALITPFWVLSHYPCLLTLTGPVSVYIKTTHHGKPTQVVKLKRTVIHPHYKDEHGTKSVALIELEEAARLGPNDTLAQITDKDFKHYYGLNRCKFRGYGIHLNTNNTSKYGVLYSGTIGDSIRKGSEGCGCLADEIDSELREEVLCFSGEENGRICSGDYGSPLVCFEENDYVNETGPVMVGIAHNVIACKSYNEIEDFKAGKLLPCSSINATDIYTDLYPYRSWILATITERKPRASLPTAHRVSASTYFSAPLKIKLLIFIIFLIYTC